MHRRKFLENLNKCLGHDYTNWNVQDDGTSYRRFQIHGVIFPFIGLELLDWLMLRKVFQEGALWLKI